MKETEKKETPEITLDANKIKDDLSADFQHLLSKQGTKFDEKLADVSEKLESLGATTGKIEEIQETLKAISASMGTVKKIEESFVPKEKDDDELDITDDDWYSHERAVPKMQDWVLKREEKLLKQIQDVVKESKNGDQGLTKEALAELVKSDEFKSILKPFVEETGRTITDQAFEDRKFSEEVSKLEENGIPREAQQAAVEYYKKLDKEKQTATTIAEMLDAFKETDKGQWIKKLLPQSDKEDEKELSIQKLLNRVKVPRDPGIGAESVTQEKSLAEQAAEAFRTVTKHGSNRTDDILRISK